MYKYKAKHKAWATWPPWLGTRLQGLLSIPGQTKIQTQTRPSILGATHQMAHKKITGSVWGGTGWYLVELGQYNLVLVLGYACIYIEKAEIWSGDTNP